MKSKNKYNEMDENVYVVIATFNGTEWIDKCLNSIPNHYQIILHMEFCYILPRDPICLISSP